MIPHKETDDKQQVLKKIEAFIDCFFLLKNMAATPSVLVCTTQRPRKKGEGWVGKNVPSRYFRVYFGTFWRSSKLAIPLILLLLPRGRCQSEQPRAENKLARLLFRAFYSWPHRQRLPPPQKPPPPPEAITNLTEAAAAAAMLHHKSAVRRGGATTPNGLFLYCLSVLGMHCLYFFGKQLEENQEWKQTSIFLSATKGQTNYWGEGSHNFQWLHVITFFLHVCQNRRALLNIPSCLPIKLCTLERKLKTCQGL